MYPQIMTLTGAVLATAIWCGEALAGLEECQTALVVATYSQFQSDSSDWRLSTIVTEDAYQAAKAGFSGRAVIYGIPMGSDYNQFNESRNQRLAQHNESLSTQQIQNILWTGLNGASLAAYQECLKAHVLNDRGLHLTPKSATASEITLTITWTPIGRDPNPLRLTWIYLGEGMSFPQRITAGSNDIIIPRPSVERAIAVNARGFGDSIILTPIPPPPPGIGEQRNPEFKVLASDAPPPCDTPGSPSPPRVPTQANGLYNLAQLRIAQAAASSLIQGWSMRHTISNLNDGWYNNCRSWIPAIMPAWASVDLGADYKISVIAFGSEFQAAYRDRAATSFQISTATAAAPANWSPVYVSNSNEQVRDRREFHFSERVARYVRIDISASTEGDVRIDEIEVYGKY